MVLRFQEQSGNLVVFDDISDLLKSSEQRPFSTEINGRLRAFKFAEHVPLAEFRGGGLALIAFEQHQLMSIEIEHVREDGAVYCTIGSIWLDHSPGHYGPEPGQNQTQPISRVYIHGSGSQASFEQDNTFEKGVINTGQQLVIEQIGASKSKEPSVVGSAITSLAISRTV